MKKMRLSDSFSGFTIAITISIIPIIDNTVRGARDQKNLVETPKVVLMSYSSRTVHIPSAINVPPIV